MSIKRDFITSLRNMTETDLENRVREDELRIKKLKFAHAVSPLENPMSIRDLKKDIARTKTEILKRKQGTTQTENK